jgi:cyclic pyranopterin phosphate synthase
MGSDDGEDVDHRPQQTAAFYLKRINKLHHHLALENIRLTGGEPLLYRELPELIKGITQTGITDIKLTTNGFLLEKQAAELKKAGLKAVNISLDAIDEEVFYAMSKRRQVTKVFKGIDAALANGLEVKLNAVIMKGYNQHQVLPLLNYAFEKNIPIRFLEVMAMGHLHQNHEDYIFKQQQILEIISSKYSLSRVIRKKSATANYWKTHTGQTFGIIANESAPFCQDCNRLRMDHAGNLYGCLSVNQGFYFDEHADEEILKETLQTALQQKQLLKFTGSTLSMLKIGG